MGYYAKIESGIVTQVVASGTTEDCESGTWIETRKDGSIRNKYAGKGDTYDSDNDVFIRAKPFDSWTLDGSYNWNPPTAVPSDWELGVKDYIWSESTQAWVEP